jgi:neutral ceramidase
MNVGCAGCIITPDRPLLLEGYGGRDRPAEGTLDPLEARAIVFDDGHTEAAILMVDVCGLTRASTRRIRSLVEAACAIRPEHVMVTYSHTHSAPATTPYVNQPPDPSYLAWLEQALAELVTTARGRLQPARLAVGEGQADFNVNRRLRTPEGMVMRANPHGLVDRRVRVLRFEPAGAPLARGTLGNAAMPQADPLAVLFSYVCHPTVLGGANYRYSSDYPGAARRVVEGTFSAPDGGAPACLAGFLPGCFGDVRPHLLSPDGRFREGTPHELLVLGRRLGGAVLQAAEALPAGAVETIAMATREVTLPYASLPTVEDLQAALAGPRRYWARALLERLEREDLPEAEITEVQVLRLGRHWLVALPGETTLEIGLAIERSLAELGLARPDQGDMTLSIGYANDYVAYLPSASLMTEGGYEVTSWYEYLRCGPFTPDLEGRLVQAALGLALELGAA